MVARSRHNGAMDNLIALAGGWTGFLHIAFIGGVFVVAGMVKGVTGMGLPTVAAGLLTLGMTPLEAAALLIVPSALTNAWQLLAGPALYPLWRRLRVMLLASCAGTALAGLVHLPAGWSGAVLGLALLAYALLGLRDVRWHVAPRDEARLAPLVGLATGMLAGASGVFMMPAVPYLQALTLTLEHNQEPGQPPGRESGNETGNESAQARERLVQAMGLAFTVSTLALAVMLACRGEWHPAAAGASLLAVPPALAGMWLGQRLRRRMAPALFRRCFFICLLALGTHLCVAAL
jgi:uncharacterized membrane protein YfcA